MKNEWIKSIHKRLRLIWFDFGSECFTHIIIIIIIKWRSNKKTSKHLYGLYSFFKYNEDMFNVPVIIIIDRFFRFVLFSLFDRSNIGKVGWLHKILKLMMFILSLQIWIWIELDFSTHQFFLLRISMWYERKNVYFFHLFFGWTTKHAIVFSRYEFESKKIIWSSTSSLIEWILSFKLDLF